MAYPPNSLVSSPWEPSWVSCWVFSSEGWPVTTLLRSSVASARWPAPFGQAWMKAVLLVVVPLIVCDLVLAAAGDGVKQAAQVGGLSLAVLVGMMLSTGGYTLTEGCWRMDGNPILRSERWVVCDGERGQDEMPVEYECPAAINDCED